jgi:hypothetical protein
VGDAQEVSMNIHWIACPREELDAEEIFDLLVEARKPGRQIFYFAQSEVGPLNGQDRDIACVAEVPDSETHTRQAVLKQIRSEADEDEAEDEAMHEDDAEDFHPEYDA